MCGLAGIYDTREASRPVQRRELAAMVAQLRHRGPDATGFFAEGRLGLGHARLSIIDLLGGDQPLHNEDRSVWTVCNGEIFNFRELRKELQAQGHVFATGSDCEVIVHLYERDGDEFVHKLNGQFALALWDARRQRLLLARDRAGILPLFYTCRDGRLLFASEVKGLLPLFDQPPRLNRRALDQLMTFWAPLSPETMFEGVYEVEPGCMLIAADGKFETKRYWDWQFPPAGEWLRAGEGELREQLHDLLLDATSLRLHADVPVGAYLSGGLDSSALSALIRHHGKNSLRTFSVGFTDNAFDEGGYQRLMARHLGTEHSVLSCTPGDIAQAFPEAVWHAETPLLRTAPVPMGLLSKAVHAQGYKVVLTGEGADEVLGGYDLFKEAKIRRFWAQQATSSWRPLLLQRLYPYLNLKGRQGQAYLQQFFGAGLEEPHAPFFSHLPRWTTTAKCKVFFSPALREALTEDALAPLQRQLPAGWPDWHPFNRAQYLEAKVLLSRYLLSSQGDRMLMANALEGRFPYLDHRLIEFAARLPPKLKMKVLNEKYLFKRAMQAYLPDAIRARPKQPYRAPDIPAFFEGRQQDYVQELLGERAVHDYGYFDARAVAHLLRKIRMGRAIGYKDNMALVSILSTQLWHHLFVEGFARRFGKDAATEWSNTDRGDFNDDHATRTQLHTGELLVHGRSAGPGR